jgi:hypothetical protein
VVAPVAVGADGNVAAPVKVVSNFILMIPLERVPSSDSQNVAKRLRRLPWQAMSHTTEAKAPQKYADVKGPIMMQQVKVYLPRLPGPSTFVRHDPARPIAG